MAIERPSQQAVNQFIRTQEAKKDTGSWWGYTPYALLGVTAFGLFHHSLYWSMTPSGIVPRILYEKSLSLPRRHLRHLLPAAIAIGSVSSLLISCSSGILPMAYGAMPNDEQTNTNLIQ